MKMKLKEFESKILLRKAGVKTSEGILIKNIEEIKSFNGNKLLKVQTLTGGRCKAGGVVLVENEEKAKSFSNQFFNQRFCGESIEEILLEHQVKDIMREFYLGIMFDTSKKCPVLIFSEEGGVDIEEVKREKPEKINLIEIDYSQGLNQNQLNFLINDDELNKQLKEVINKVYDCFVRFDCRMLEINPLALTKQKKLIALDGVAVLDDDANFRREINFSERTDNKEATPREIAARKIDEEDHRGVAGKTFLDLDGDIAILTSGGGATMTAIDALVFYGGKPANYTEYGGNPTREKVKKLTTLVLEKEKLSGLFIAGVIANFTDVANTLSGVLDVLVEKKPNFPIVIRRAGLNDHLAKKEIIKVKEEYKLDIHYFDENTTLTESAEIMAKLSKEYKNGNIN